MKILVISDYAYPAGGIEVFIDQIIAMTNKYIEYKILTWPPYEVGEKRIETAPTIRVLCGDYLQIWKELDWADLLFYQASWNIRIFGSVIRDYCNVNQRPLISVVHTSSNTNREKSSSSFQRELLKDIIKISNRVVGVSNDVTDSLRELDIDSQDKYLTIENGTRFQSYNKKLKGRNTISFIGRPTKAKGIDIFFDLAFKLIDTDLKFNINTVSIPLPIEFRNLLERNKKINCQYLLSDDEMVEFYSSTDLLIVPYRHSDGLPLVILEALSFGIPIIGINAPGVSDILLRHNQFLVDQNDINKLDQVIRKWHEGENIVNVPNTNNIPDWKEQSMKYVSIFKEVLSE